jgi:thiamine-monophosphate kinase
MNTSEFDVIKKFFSFANSRDDVILAGGDDCAILSVPENKQLLVTTDTLISGVHFPENTSPENIAYKSIMVNLSDLAAMGATPSWITLAISLPEIDESWLTAFSNEFSSVLSEFNISLIGGDTTKGPLSITIQAMGLSDKVKILRRDQAKPGDRIFVTGDLGDAAIGLHALLNNLDDEKLSPCIKKLNRPEIKVKFAEELARYSKCAIDISDGLIADLGHIIRASHCGAKVRLSDIPLSLSAQYYFQQYHAPCHKSAIDWSMVLTQGDDYELCFTVNKDDEPSVKALAEKYSLKITCIGEITDSAELVCVNSIGEIINFSGTGFQHF